MPSSAREATTVQRYGLKFEKKCACDKKNPQKTCTELKKGLPLHRKRDKAGATNKIALWCNGSTSDSGSACESSNLSKATKNGSSTELPFFCCAPPRPPRPAQQAPRAGPPPVSDCYRSSSTDNGDGHTGLPARGRPARGRSTPRRPSPVSDSYRSSSTDNGDGHTSLPARRLPARRRPGGGLPCRCPAAPPVSRAALGGKTNKTPSREDVLMPF